MLFRIGVLILITLCIAVFGYFIASAQDNVKRVETKEAKESGDVMYIEKVDGPQDGSEAKVQVFIKSEDGKTVIIDSNSVNKRSEKQADQEQRRKMRDMMQSQGLSPADMKNPDVMKKLQEKAQNMGKEQGGTPAPTSGSSPQDQQKQAKGQGPAPADEGLNRYLNVISSKNLFLPLGSSRKEQKQSYVLTGVISSEMGKTDNKAIIEQAGGQRSFYVSQGDTVGDDAKVTEIGEWQVKLNRSGEQMTLKLGEGSSRGGPGSMEGPRGGEGPKGAPPGESGRKGESRTNRVAKTDDFNPDEIPPFIRKILEQRGISIDDLKNNPELREKLKQEFETGIKNGSIQVPPGMR